MACYRFGAFAMETDTGEVRKHGVRLKLGGQPFQVLQMMVENAGRLVTREELKKALWPDNTFTDFDHGINLAVQRIRRVLGDSAQEPTYIETLPARGYRFIAPVESEVPAAGDPPKAVPPRRLRLATLAVALIGVAAAIVYLAGRQAKAPLAFTVSPVTADRGAEASPNFSPEGSRIAYSLDGDIYVKLIGADSGEPLRLIGGATEDLQPAWSPDGASIAFIRVLERNPAPRGGRYAVMVAPAAPGGQQRTLVEVNSRNDHLQPAWSKDGKHLVFSARPGETSGPNRLCLLALESRELRFLTSPPTDSAALGDYYPTFSPDGTMLAFYSNYRRGGGGQLSVVTLTSKMQVAGALRPLAPTRWTRPAWTPDGKELIFCQTSQEGPEGIRIASLSGAARPRLLWPAECEYEAAVTSFPGGMRIVYKAPIRDRDLVRTGLAAPYRGETAVLISTTKDEYNPQVSPDGKHIAFLSDKSGTRDIWICNADGGNQQKLTAAGKAISHPAWSPDGRRIAYQGDSQQTEIFVVEVDGGSTRQLTSHGGMRPAWSTDGQWIYFFSARDGVNRIWRISTEGAEEQPLIETRENGFAAESMDGNRLYFSQSRGLMMLTLGDHPGKPPVVVADEMLPPGVFSVSGRGVFYLTPFRSLRFYDPARGETKEILPVDKTAADFSVSPDQQWMVYSRAVSSGSDLMMLETVP
jgi:Tol biopolymer transport system component/DNA-binding winged helix-turn-helix (wHTH) protein